MFKYGFLLIHEQSFNIFNNLSLRYASNFTKHNAKFQGSAPPRPAVKSRSRRTARESMPLSSFPDIGHSEADTEINKKNLLFKSEKEYLDGNAGARPPKPPSKRYMKKKAYFAEKYPRSFTYPNLLLWEQKCQIRTLHSEKPEDWHLDRLAGLFPASTATIKKILASDWEPEDIQRHDAAVLRHWGQFLAGEIIIPDPALKVHLLKFAPKFLKDSVSPAPALEPDEDSPRGKRFNKKEIQVDWDPHISGEDKPAEAEEITDPDSEQTPVTRQRQVTRKTNYFKIPAKYDVKKVDAAKKIKPCPQHIFIPEDKYVEGATYKLKDAFYHSDGTFLYRVPGMT